ncbi:unnamed protein product [Urochloa humidicola]
MEASPPTSPPPPGSSPADDHHQPTQPISACPTTIPQPSHPLSPTNAGAVDIHYEGSSEDGSPVHRQDRRHDKTLAAGKIPAGGQDGKAKLVSERRMESRDKGKAVASPGEVVTGCGPSYKDALLRPRTFRPRFPDTHHHGWYNEFSMGGPKKASVRSRLGSSGSKQVRLAASTFNGVPPGGSAGSYWHQRLRAKAGNKCFNCLGAGHSIASCRDPPRCLLCLRFGHKARFCPAHRVAPSASMHRALASNTSQLLPASAAGAPVHATAAAIVAAAAAPAAAASVTAAAPAAAAASKMMDMEEDGYVRAFLWNHGAPEHRPEHVTVGMHRTDAIQEEERDLEIFSLLAVQVDARFRLETDIVRREAVRQLRVPFHELGVARLSEATFLIKFGDQHQRNAAKNKALRIGHSGLQLMPWSRRVGAANELSKYRFRVRLCIEGIPSHARQMETVAGLFNNPAFIDEFNCDKVKPEEESCVCLWAWTPNPDGFAKTGTLEIAEPVTLPEPGYAESLQDLGMPASALRFGAADLLKYQVIIHLDKVLDYATPLNSPSRRSVDSAISAVPDDEVEDQWPASHPFVWHLGVPDGVESPRRVSVHERLGGHERQGPPPRGGGGAGGAGGGLHQRPPSGVYALGAFGRSMQHGESSRGGGAGHGGHYRRRSGPPMVWAWRAKNSDIQCRPKGQKRKSKDSNNSQGEPGDSFLVRESQAVDQCRVDPMLEESTAFPDHGRCQAMLLQCSVEPTAAERPLESSAVPQREEESDSAALQTGIRSWQADLCINEHDTAECVNIDQHKEQDPLEGEDLVPLCRLTGCAELIEEGTKEDNRDQPISLPGANKTDALLVSLENQTENDNSGQSFDLNVAVQAAEEIGQSKGMQPTIRKVLGAADTRLNKEGKEHSGQKTFGKGILRLAVPLKKSLLCNPAHKAKTGQPKKQAEASSQLMPDRKVGRNSAKGFTNASMEDKATSFLLESCGIIEKNGRITAAAEEQFGEQFINQMKADLVGNMRTAFALPVGAEGVIDVLAVEAEE